MAAIEKRGTLRARALALHRRTLDLRAAFETPEIRRALHRAARRIEDESLWLDDLSNDASYPDSLTFFRISPWS